MPFHFPIKLLEFMVEWFAFQEILIYLTVLRLSGNFKGNFVPFTFVLKVPEFLVTNKWKEPLNV